MVYDLTNSKILWSKLINPNDSSLSYVRAIKFAPSHQFLVALTDTD